MLKINIVVLKFLETTHTTKSKTRPLTHHLIFHIDLEVVKDMMIA